MKPNPVAFKMAPAEMMQQETHVSKAYPGGAEPRLWRSKATILAQEGTASMHSQQQPAMTQDQERLLIKESERLVRRTQQHNLSRL